MPNLKATATINFAKSKIKFASLEPHIFRTYKQMNHDKNKRMNHKLSKLNGSGFPINYEKFMEKFVNKKKLAKQRKKYLSHRQKSRARKFASPKAFIQSKNHRNCRCGVITLGDHTFQNKLDKIIQNRFPKLNDISQSYFRQDLLKSYLKNFNPRHKYIKIIAYSIHGDEQFIHAHAEFMGIPTRSKKGNLQLNFNKSLRLEMRNKKEIQAGKLPSNRVALYRFQQQEDPLILKTANEAFGVTLTRHGASKDDQQQHSLAVSESAKASSYASIASSSASYLNSLNVDFRASLSKSATKSLKARKRTLASSAKSLSIAKATFDSSAYGSYSNRLSNVLTPHLNGSASNKYWLNLAKGNVTIKTTKDNKPIHNPLAYMANSMASKAASANNAYVSTQTSNKSLNNENSSLHSENSSLSSNISNQKNKLNQSFHQDLLDLGTNKKVADHWYHNGGMPLEHGKRKPLIKCIISRVHTLITSIKDKAEIKARKIIHHAKRQVKEWDRIDDFGGRAMQDYINSYNPHFTDNPSKSQRQKGIKDAFFLTGKGLADNYNNTAKIVHSQKVRQRQKQKQRGWYWGE